MTAKNYLWILYAISATIIITIGVQIYWNYNNYQLNKQRVSNEIQLSIDNALEEYYAEIAKSDFLTIIKPYDTTNIRIRNRVSEEISKFTKSLSKSKELKAINISSISFEKDTIKKTDTIGSRTEEKAIDTFAAFTKFTSEDSGIHFENGQPVDFQVLRGKKAFDSLKVMKKLNTIMISMNRDTLKYDQVDSLLNIQFKQKHISPNYKVKHFKKDTLYHSFNSLLNGNDLMSVTSKSTYLKPNERIVLEFENPMKDALKLSLTGIITSLLLAIAIISCLFYLLHIIRHQKQLAEVKNDLISNITHEFKTPISTIGVALEGLKNFNALDNKAKTQNYLNISNDQLGKLTVMVEKLLETATLDSDQLELHKERINMVELIQQLVERHQVRNDGKNIIFDYVSNVISANVDPFHIENAINNIIDNAIKYGGDKIIIGIQQNLFATTIDIADTGDSLKKVNKEKIFEKFYRVPKGNMHDIKGFGIGLYYTKKIIEKHNGTIILNLNNQLTTFKISFPNE